jgi:hypothetical protein
MRSWQVRIWNIIFYVAGRVFAEGAYTPVVSLEMMISVRFAIPKVAKQRMLKIT